MNCNTTHYRANSSSVPGDPTDKEIKSQIAAAYDAKFEFLFTQLGIANTARAVAEHVKPVVQHRMQPHEGMATVAAAPDDADLSD